MPSSSHRFVSYENRPTITLGGGTNSHKESSSRGFFLTLAPLRFFFGLDRTECSWKVTPIGLWQLESRTSSFLRE